tara:strand:+ start:4173 stop:4655 length:483 start_codon:yes stop_codon:yes gene_type:complete
MIKVWKTIKPSSRKSILKEIKYLKKKGILLSPWIENIYLNKKNNIKLSRNSVKLYKIKVRSLGFKKATTLEKIYKKIKKKKFSLVKPDIALNARLYYKEQKKGEWLRFATPFNSMIDTDGVPHLPKHGKALNKLFIETYWAYRRAIFHPHNEFVVCKYDI